MLRNYLIIAWRNMVRRKIYTIINIMGLAMGISACMVIYLIAHYELSFDTFHPDKERIYRITTETQEHNGQKFYWKAVPPAMPTAISEEMSGIENIAGLYPYDAQISILNRDNQAERFDSRIEGGYITTTFTGPAYFDIFKYHWLAGNAATALNEPFKAVLTKSKALRYFGSLQFDKIIGKEVVYNDSLHVSVSGVIEDWDENTDLRYTDFISMGTIRESFLKAEVHLEGWTNNNYSPTVFVKLAQGTDPAQVNLQLEQFIKKRVALLVAPGNKMLLQLQPLPDVHFTGDYNRGGGIWHEDGDQFAKAHLPTLYGLMGGALFILIIAIVNFVNLSTAQSIRRAKEIGIRKVMGSLRASLVIQFLIETLVHTSIAICISLLLVNPVLREFDSFIPNGIKFDLFDPPTLLFILLAIIVTSLLAGFYPATVLSSYLPAQSLRGVSGHKGNGRGYLRRGLIVFQFAISLVFIIGTLVIGNQIRFMRKELNFTNGAIISLWGGERKNVSVLAEKIKQLAGVNRVALQGFPPVGMARAIRPLRNQGKDESYIGVSVKVGNEDFIPFYEMKLLAGRNLQQTDSIKEFVINRSYSKFLGFTKPAEALGQLIYWDADPYPVVGVVEDFHEGSFHELIAPIAITNNPQEENNIVIKLGTPGKEATDVQALLSQVENQWKQVYPDQPFNFSFLDDDIAMLFEKEQRAAILMNAAMMITIFISCMGVFGLAMFSAQIRTKEIGIRKVLGATVANITAMLSKEFVLLVLIATIISSPIAWYFMDQWLQDFAYRIQISWWVFVVAGLAAMAIALATVSFQAIKAARANPIDSLRTE